MMKWNIWRNESSNYWIYFFSFISLSWIILEVRELSIVMKDFNLRLNLGKSRNISVFIRLLVSLMWISSFFIDESMKVFRLSSLANSNNCCQLPKKQHSIYITHVSRDKDIIQNLLSSRKWSKNFDWLMLRSLMLMEFSLSCTIQLVKNGWIDLLIDILS